MRYMASVEESIKRILETPKGSRVMLPEFGSNLYTLIDKRADDVWRLMFISFCYEAINRWERRVRVAKVTPKIDAVSGKVDVVLLLSDKQTKQKREVIIYGAA